MLTTVFTLIRSTLGEKNEMKRKKEMGTISNY